MDNYFEFGDLTNFKRIEIPKPIESKGSPEVMVKWGGNNLYPNFLLDLYNDSAIHGGYINSKVTYILGDGLKAKGNDDSNLNDIKVNATDTLYEFVRKCVLDYELFKSFAVEVQYNAANEAIIYNHIPLQNIRTNRLKDSFWYCPDWTQRNGIIEYDRFQIYSSDSNSKIFYYDGYRPSKYSVYSIPDYVTAIKDILTDISIAEFNHNQIKSHFSVSTLINYFMGEPKIEVKRAMMKQLNDLYTGENGNRFLVSFSNPDGKAPEVQQLSAGDWANAFIELSKNVDDKISNAHQITSRILFGKSEAGSLGNGTELEIAYEVFSNTYIRERRNDLVNAFNLLFQNSNVITNDIEFIERPLFAKQTSDELKEKIYTINELRAEAGKEPIVGGDRLLSEAQAPQQFNLISEDSDKKKDDAKATSRRLTDEDFEKIKHLGADKDNFEIVENHKFSSLDFNVEQDVAKYIIEHDITQLKVGELVDILDDAGVKVTQQQLSTILQGLEKSGAISIENNPNDTISITPSVTGTIPDTDEIQVLYDYVKKPSASGSELIATSRGFCVKLCNSNRYYSREDIQAMSLLFGYDVYQHTGGWYHDPVAETTTNSCRHMWQRVAVKPKKIN